MADARGSLQTLEDRSYATYRARLQASIRLAQRSRAWNTSAIALATATTVASVGMLTDPEMYGPDGETLLVCVAVLTLVASLVTSSLDYSGRSRDTFVNYRKIQRLSAEVERAKTGSSLTLEDDASLYAKYDDMLDESENHTPADHLRQDPKNRWTWPVLKEDALTLFPYVTLAIPAALLVPLLRALVA